MNIIENSVRDRLISQRLGAVAGPYSMERFSESNDVYLFIVWGNSGKG